MPEPTRIPTVPEAERALAAARVDGDPKRVGDAEVFLGVAQFEARAPTDAVASFVSAEQTYAAGGLAREAVVARLNRARCLSELDRGEEAVALYETTADEQSQSDLMLAWAAWGGLAEHLDRVGPQGRTEALFDGLLTEARASGDELRIAYFESWVGGKFCERGDPSRGLPLLASALRRYQALGRSELVASTLMVKGVAHHEAGEHHQAADCFARAAAAYDVHGDAEGAAAARHNLDVVS